MRSDGPSFPTPQPRGQSDRPVVRAGGFPDLEATATHSLQEVPTGLGHPATSSASILVLKGKGPETREESLASPKECGDSMTRGGRAGDSCPWGFTKLGSSLKLPWTRAWRQEIWTTGEDERKQVPQVQPVRMEGGPPYILSFYRAARPTRLPN